ncbi:hypothetical protein NM208_g8172 [Fusarium decemcellulare]|uniref:Uncharacterized protein n=1 Tax=Fusarium decemcellulare TaxID=57161 RepID=A0ACC1S6G2_9HYPO|nr:hypothetical protein NM208_g8172 [Fusarium decemcellulare]
MRSFSNGFTRSLILVIRVADTDGANNLQFVLVRNKIDTGSDENFVSAEVLLKYQIDPAMITTIPEESRGERTLQTVEDFRFTPTWQVRLSWHKPNEMKQREDLFMVIERAPFDILISSEQCTTLLEMFFEAIVSLLFFAAISSAWDAPGYGGYNLVWQDNFAGSAGTLPDGNNWNIITGYLNVNAELEVYTSSTSNVQRSGGSTLQLVPWRDSSALKGWTSGRIESKYVFTPQPARVTRMEASIRFGDSPIANKQGIWPALLDAWQYSSQWWQLAILR